MLTSTDKFQSLGNPITFFFLTSASLSQTVCLAQRASFEMGKRDNHSIEIEIRLLAHFWMNWWEMVCRTNPKHWFNWLDDFIVIVFLYTVSCLCAWFFSLHSLSFQFFLFFFPILIGCTCWFCYLLSFDGVHTHTHTSLDYRFLFALFGICIFLKLLLSAYRRFFSL